MSKAILVMDMPNKCYDCLFYHETRDEDDDYVSKCRALKDMTIDGFIDKYFDCPLSEVQQEKSSIETDDIHLSEEDKAYIEVLLRGSK